MVLNLPSKYVIASRARVLADLIIIRVVPN
jgi:hypothetical protein